MAEFKHPRRLPEFKEILKNLDYYLAVVTMLFVAVYGIFTVISRFIFGKTSATMDELNMIVFIWFLYASIIYCVRLDRHIRVEFLDMYLPEKAKAILKITADVIWFAFSLYLTYASFILIQFNMKHVAKTAMLEIPMYVIYLILLLSFTAMTVFLARNITVKVKRFKDILKNASKGDDKPCR